MRDPLKLLALKSYLHWFILKTEYLNFILEIFWTTMPFWNGCCRSWSKKKSKNSLFPCLTNSLKKVILWQFCFLIPTTSKICWSWTILRKLTMIAVDLTLTLSKLVTLKKPLSMVLTVFQDCFILRTKFRQCTTAICNPWNYFWNGWLNKKLQIPLNKSLKRSLKFSLMMKSTWPSFLVVRVKRMTLATKFWKSWKK